LRKFSNIEKKLTKHNNLINKKFLQYITNYNLQDIKKIRRINFNFLISNINQKNVLNLNYNNETPLFFNLRLRSKKKRDYLRINLKKQNIFCPVHWKLRYNNKYPLSSDMSFRILSIPIDQRYKLNDMKIIANTINKLL
jgi:dTDP-4-amino-4,6-dideoxygalactose transaminase